MECLSCPAYPIIDAFAKTNNLARMVNRKDPKKPSQLHPVAKSARILRDAIYAVCNTCLEHTDFNNLPNHGQTFYSLDAKIKNAQGEFSNLTYADILPATPPKISSPLTELPTDIEETLISQFTNFKHLQPLDFCLIAHLMRGGSLSSFASMNWLDAFPIDPLTNRPVPITRQAVHTRFKHLKELIPVLLAVFDPHRKHRPKRSQKGEADAPHAQTSTTPTSIIKKARYKMTAVSSNPALKGVYHHALLHRTGAL